MAILAMLEHGQDARRVAHSEAGAAIRVVESAHVVSRQAEVTEFQSAPTHFKSPVQPGRQGFIEIHKIE